MATVSKPKKKNAQNTRITAATPALSATGKVSAQSQCSNGACAQKTNATDHAAKGDRYLMQTWEASCGTNSKALTDPEKGSVLHISSTINRDDAANGMRGLRAQSSAALFTMLRERYGIDGVENVTDLGGSSNLNLLVCVGQKRYVVRVYRPYVTSARLADIHLARRELAAGGVPCCDTVKTRENEAWTRLGDRLVEIEHYVASDARMDSWERLQIGLPLLGRIHTLQRRVSVSAAGATPLFANHVEPFEALNWTLQATQRIRAWNPSPDELLFAQKAEALAHALDDAEREATPALPRQLVHGDFWDNNVFFRAGRVVFVADFDFMGERARIDDLALTLYFTSLSLAQSDSLSERIDRLRPLVDAYDAGLDEPLTVAERTALPLALARQPLWATGRWLALLDDQQQARRLALETHGDVDWALQIMSDLNRWQDGFA